MGKIYYEHREEDGCFYVACVVENPFKSAQVGIWKRVMPGSHL